MFQQREYFLLMFRRSIGKFQNRDRTDMRFVARQHAAPELARDRLTQRILFLEIEISGNCGSLQVDCLFLFFHLFHYMPRPKKVNRFWLAFGPYRPMCWAQSAGQAHEDAKG